MGFQSNGLRDVFEGQGEAGFIAYTYATFDPLEEVLAPGYFSGCKRLAVGDLIFVGTRPRPVTSAWMAAQKQTPIRRALLMVAARDEWNRVAVRLVQDYGGPSDGNASIGGDGPMDGNGPMVGSGPMDGPVPVKGAMRRWLGMPRQSMQNAVEADRGKRPALEYAHERRILRQDCGQVVLTYVSRLRAACLAFLGCDAPARIPRTKVHRLSE